MNRIRSYKFVALAILSFFVEGLREQFCTANIEQGTPTAQNLSSLERKTWKAVFYPTGSTQGDDFGVIQTGKIDYGGSRDHVMAPVDGDVILAVDELISVKPMLNFEGSQFHSTIKPYLLLGTKRADVVQSSASGATANITAKLGKTFDIGARNVTLTSVTVAAAAKTRDVDFFFEENKGLIRFPQVAAGIADAAAVVVTFDKPALTREKYTAFDNLNPSGTMVLYEMDNKNKNVPRDEWSIPGVVSVDDAGEASPEKFRRWKAKFSINGIPTVLGRAA
jgi:hypothetical protein